MKKSKFSFQNLSLFLLLFLFQVIFSRRAGNYIYMALAEVSRVNALEKSQRRLRRKIKRLKQGLPHLAVPEDSGGEDLAGPSRYKRKWKTKLLKNQHTKCPESRRIQGSNERREKY